MPVTDRRAGPIALVLALLLAGCGSGDGAGEEPGTAPSTSAPSTSAPTTSTAPSTTTTEGPVADTPYVDPEMSEEAQAMRERIARAAAAGDVRLLAELALEGDTTFTASFGQDFARPDELAAYWRRLEAEGEPIAATISALLQLPTFATTAHDPTGDPVRIHVSPRAMSEDAGPEDRTALEEALGAERVSRWWADGMYLGYRLGVDARGDWRFFVIGD